MNRQSRDSFTATTDQTQLAYGESACLETPPDLFAALHAEFHFDIDLTANEHNHLLPLWFGPGAERYDAIGTPWRQYGKTGFCNPPYGDFVKKIIPKAVTEQHYGFTSVFLLSLRVNRTFKQQVLRYADELRWVDERITFWYTGKPKPSARVKYSQKKHADFPNLVCRDKRGANGGYAFDTFTGAYLLEPAGALFDSIVVVFRGRANSLHFGPKSSVWHWDPERRKKLALQDEV